MQKTRIKNIKMLAMLFLMMATAHGLTFSTSTQRLVDTVLGRAVDCDFAQSLYTIDSSLVSSPNDPLLLMVKLAVVGMRDLDADFSIDTLLFINTCTRANKAIESFEQKVGESSYSLTIRGMINGTYATYCLQRSEYLKGLGPGMDAMKQLTRARELDPANVDVGYFLGLYDYARAELRKKFWWVLFWYPGNKAKGIAQLEACAAHASVTALASSLALCDIYRQEKMYDKALKLLDQLTMLHPRSRFIMWTKGKTYESLHQCGKAAEIFSALADSYKSSGIELFCVLNARLYQANMLAANGDTGDARTLYEQIIFDAQKRTDEPYRKILDRAKSSLQKMNKK